MPLRLLSLGTSGGGGGAGNVIGPGSSTDNAVVRWDGASGTSIQNSTAILTDLGILTLAGQIIGSPANTSGTLNVETAATFSASSGGAVATVGLIPSNGPSAMGHTDQSGNSTLNNSATLIQYGGSGFAVSTSPVTAVGVARIWTEKFAVNIAGDVTVKGTVDMTAIAAGTANFTITPTSDTPTVAFTGGGNAPTTAPAGYIEISVSGNARYIPFWA